MDPADVKTKPWTIEVAMDIYTDLSNLVTGSEFILTMHGSVLKYGAGNDLDLLAVQWRGVTGDGFRESRFDQLLKRFCQHSGFSVRQVERLSRQRIHVKFYYDDGRPYRGKNMHQRIVDLLIVML